MRSPRRVPVHVGGRVEGDGVMDPNGRIYQGDENMIPAEDKARLEGYLRGRAEAHREELLAEMEARIREFEKGRDGS